MTRRVTIPEGQVAVLMTEQLADEVKSLIMSRRRELGARMSRVTALSVGASEEAARAADERWHKAKVERDILNDLLLALVDGMTQS